MLFNLFYYNPNLKSISAKKLLSETSAHLAFVNKKTPIYESLSQIKMIAKQKLKRKKHAQNPSPMT